eukprot:GFUD01029118.1.p1 GENE.GFUD01029118.1~~GFUD01029118.1.p1  ORF type:complete len:442 (+),score=129.66 GFUD01029118.1:55-1380(+)
MSKSSGPSSSNSAEVVTRLLEITGCGQEVAVKLLQQSGLDLAAAVDKFYNTLEVVGGRDNTRTRGMEDEDEFVLNMLSGSDMPEVMDNNKRLKVSPTPVVVTDDGQDELETTIKIETVLEYTEEEMVQKAIEDSVAEHLKNEPDQETCLQILMINYPKLDQDALKDLCQEYKGRSAELEKFVQFHIQDLPTREKVQLQSQIEEIIAAGVEGAEEMIVEECPGCKVPKIVEDPSAKVFTCLNTNCQGEFCRKCKKEQHIPYKCQGQMVDDNLEFQVINVLPKRQFDESDLLDKEFRIAEGYFLRMKDNTKKNYKIQSIDIIFNRDLGVKFDKKKAELTVQGFGDCLLLFHGTPQKNIQPILKNNFDLSIQANGRAYGDGVYFSECPEVSLGYAKDLKSLILCKVLVGKQNKEVKLQEDSRCWAIVVPEVTQILPRYVINFTD